eukprot:jgi/Botrbrau1/23211/Bobra.0041s0055.1
MTDFRQGSSTWSEIWDYRRAIPASYMLSNGEASAQVPGPGRLQPQAFHLPAAAHSHGAPQAPPPLFQAAVQGPPQGPVPTEAKRPEKACTTCGTTKTPQWREGPLGPKTLCNACGVKLGRQKKQLAQVASEGKVADKQGDRKPKTANKVGKRPVGIMKQVQAPRRPTVQRVDSPNPPSSSNTDRGNDFPPFMPHPTTSRPCRKAAARAKTATATYGATGDWPDRETSSDSPLHRSLHDALSPSDSYLSDSAQEVAYSLRHCADVLDDPQAAHKLPPEIAQQIGEDSVAAVSLLSLHHELRESPALAESVKLKYHAIRDGFVTVSSHKQSKYPLDHLADACSGHASPRAPPPGVQDMVDALNSLSPQEHLEMLEIKSDMDKCLMKAHACDSSVTAVAEVFGDVVAEAKQAHKVLSQKIVRMQDFLAKIQLKQRARQRIPSVGPGQ